jgi:hypothetical protein
VSCACLHALMWGRCNKLLSYHPSRLHPILHPRFAVQRLKNAARDIYVNDSARDEDIGDLHTNRASVSYSSSANMPLSERFGTTPLNKTSKPAINKRPLRIPTAQLLVIAAESAGRAVGQLPAIPARGMAVSPSLNNSSGYLHIHQ